MFGASKRLVLGGLILALLLPVSLRGQNTSALPWRMSTAYFNHLMREVHSQYDTREAELALALSSPDTMKAYLDEKKAAYRDILGYVPVEGDMNARVADRIETSSFILENLVFESLPGRYVTANLYLPHGNGPFPAALELCGHGLSGKVSPGQVRLGQLFTANGMALMVVDPIGQGERIQFLDGEGRTRTRGATTEHTLLNAGANLVGTSVAALEYHDNQRALDYLEGRKDINGKAMGVFGSSGGGTQTSYLVGLEDRIKVASVCSYFTRREKVLEIYGPSDGCQHIPYEGREGLEIADFVMMMAPRPVLIMSGKYDFVDFYGALEAFEELKSVYTMLGSPEKAAMFSMEGGHGMPEPKKQALVQWFRYWLRGDSLAVFPLEKEILSLENLQCSSTGQVLTALQDAVPVQEHHRQQAENLHGARKSFCAQGPEAVKEKVSELLGFSWPEEELFLEQTGSFSMRTYDVKQYQLTREGEMPLPCLVLYPESLSPDSEVVVYLHEEGKDAAFRDEERILQYMNQGNILVLADLRGIGETADPLSLNNSKYWNREYRTGMISMHSGKPIMGQRVTDIVTIMDFLEREDGTTGREVRLLADGLCGPAALHATFLDDRIHRVEIFRSVKSFMEYLDNPLQRDVYSNVLYGVLEYYDLADLAELCGRGRARFTD